MSQPFDLPHDQAHEMDFYIVQHARRHNHKIKRIVFGSGLNTRLNYICESFVRGDNTLIGCPGFLEVKYCGSDVKWHITKTVGHGPHVESKTNETETLPTPTKPESNTAVAPSKTVEQLNSGRAPASPLHSTIETLKDSTKLTINIRSTEAGFETSGGARLLQTQAIIPLIEANKDLFPNSFNIHAVVTASNGTKRDLDIIATSSTAMGEKTGTSSFITVSAAVSKHKPSISATSSPVENQTPNNRVGVPSSSFIQSSLMSPLSVTSTPLLHKISKNQSSSSVMPGSPNVRQLATPSPTPAFNRYANTRCSACHELGHRLGSRECKAPIQSKRSNLTAFGDDYVSPSTLAKKVKCSMCGSEEHRAGKCTKAVQLDKFEDL